MFSYFVLIPLSRHEKSICRNTHFQIRCGLPIISEINFLRNFLIFVCHNSENIIHHLTNALLARGMLMNYCISSQMSIQFFICLEVSMKTNIFFLSNISKDSNFSTSCTYCTQGTYHFTTAPQYLFTVNIYNHFNLPSCANIEMFTLYQHFA